MKGRGRRIGGDCVKRKGRVVGGRDYEHYRHPLYALLHSTLYYTLHSITLYALLHSITLDKDPARKRRLKQIPTKTFYLFLEGGREWCFPFQSHSPLPLPFHSLSPSFLHTPFLFTHSLFTLTLSPSSQFHTQYTPLPLFTPLSLFTPLPHNTPLTAPTNLRLRINRILLYHILLSLL